MSDELLKQLINEMQDIKANMATKQDVDSIKTKLDKLSEKIEVQHIENIRADELLLNEIRSIREGVLFVNRKVADTELELNIIKQNNKQ